MGLGLAEDYYCSNTRKQVLSIWEGVRWSRKLLFEGEIQLGFKNSINGRYMQCSVKVRCL